MKKLTVIVPVYYNEGSLPHLFVKLKDVEAALQERDMALELIFVNDGSGDRSLEELLKIKQQRPETKVISLARNFGAIHASKTGTRFATGDCFMWLAADLQDPPQLIVDMVDRWLSGYKFVICVRSARHDSRSSMFFSAIYYRLLRLLVISNYPRTGFDMALMDRRIHEHIVNSNKNVNIHLLAYWLGFKPAIIEYERPAREHGHSRWTFMKRVKLLIDSLLGFSVVPIRLISIIGFAVAVLSFMYGISITSTTLLEGSEVRGFPTLAALITFLLGLIIIMLGIIGEYIWRIFDELNKRPEVVIDEIY